MGFHKTLIPSPPTPDCHPIKLTGKRKESPEISMGAIQVHLKINLAYLKCPIREKSRSSE